MAIPINEKNYLKKEKGYINAELAGIKMINDNKTQYKLLIPINEKIIIKKKKTDELHKYRTIWQKKIINSNRTQCKMVIPINEKNNPKKEKSYINIELQPFSKKQPKMFPFMLSLLLLKFY